MKVLRWGVLLLSFVWYAACGHRAEEEPAESSRSSEGGSLPIALREPAEEVRRMAVAGQFYPGRPGDLRAMMRKYLTDADVPAVPTQGSLIALICPHAGYVYSGPIAAYSYKCLQGKKYDTVICLGPSHHIPHPTASVYDGEYYRTPLGNVPVDRAVVSQLYDICPELRWEPAAHEREHSVEVQVPFLQEVLGSFSFVSVVVGSRDLSFLQRLGAGLARIRREFKDKKILLIASTDMSHYHPYDEAVAMDRETGKLIEAMAIKKLHEGIVRRTHELCGAGPVVAVLIACREAGAKKVSILKYANSGDTSGDKSRGVVGYLAATIETGEEEAMNDNPLSESDKLALKIARETVETYVKTGQAPKFNYDDPLLQQHGGVFVTLKIHGMLRGCIGRFVSDQPLQDTISEMAISSCSRDHRFRPVTPDELEHLEYEISVLSPLKRIQNIDEVKLGKHGIYVVQGPSTGVFLPQVATETGWSKIEFLEHCCRDKAGLPKDAYKDPRTELYTFTAKIISEHPS